MKAELKPSGRTVRQDPPVAEHMEELAASGRLNARNADKHWLYEESVQNCEAEVKFIDRVFRKEFGRKPESLREDFCGTALLCRHWVAARKGNTALGVDLDGPTLDWGRANNLAALGPQADRVTLVQEDVRRVNAPGTDVLAAPNFSWWGFKTRTELKGYLQNSYASLRPEGMLLLDCFGGPEAQIPQEELREQEGFDYIWDQDDFNPITNEIRCFIHFRFDDGSRLNRAFKYDWRLWTMPEVCDILAECGFAHSVIYWEGSDRDGEPSGIFRPSRKGDLAPAWVSYILAFKHSG